MTQLPSSTSAVGLAVLLALVLTAGCAPTSPSLPPAEEVLLVVNSTEATLSVIPVNDVASRIKIPLGGTTPTPVGVSARNDMVLVPLGLDNAVAVVNLRTAQVDRVIPLAANSGATGSAFVDDSLAYVANPNLNTVTRINYLTGDTASVRVGVYPQGIAYTRGRIFVLNGNLVNFAPNGPSWITVLNPLTNQKLIPTDSIGLTGSPGNAGFSDVGLDGLLYVMNTGDYFSAQGALSIVDPVALEWKVNVTGFGTGPGNVAVDPTGQLYISSYAEGGVMQFDTRTRTIIRGAGSAVPIPLNAAVEVDSQGRIYALATGPCTGGVPGVVHVLRSDLTEATSFTVGECPVGATVTFIPPVP